MANNSSNSPRHGWRQAAGQPAGPAAGQPTRGKRKWQQSTAPVPVKTDPRKRKQIQLGLGLTGLAAVLGVLLWVVLWPRPVQPACLVLVGAGYEMNLALPENAAGWKGLEDLRELAQHTEGNKLRLHLGPQAVREHTDWEEEIWNKALTGIREQTVIVFLSLHGGVDADGPFLFADDIHTQKRMPVRDVLQKLNSSALQGKNKLLILDVTQMAAHWPSGMLHNDFAHQLRELESEIKQVPGLVVFCSSDVDQVSWVSPEWQRTIFSHYILEGLSGAADGHKARDPNKHITAWELYEYVRDKVQAWADYNRDAVQVPMFLGNENDAREMDLVLLGDEYREQPPEDARGFDSSHIAGLENQIKSAWEQWDVLQQAIPHPAVYSPHLWRQYQDTLIRYEQLLRMGDPTGKGDELKKRLGSLDEAIHNARQALPAYASLGNGLWVPAALGQQPASPDGMAQQFQLFRSNKGEAERKLAWKALRDWARDKGFKEHLPLLEVQLGQLALQPLARKDSPSHEEMKEAAELLQWVYNQQNYPRAAEPHFLIMLLHNKLAPPKPAPTPDLHRALKVRLMAEQAAWGISTDEKEYRDSHPYSEMVWQWIRPIIEKADEERQFGEDYLFGSTAKSWDRARQHLAEAEKLYVSAVKEAREVRLALHARDTALAVLPYYAQWAAGQWLYDLTPDRKAKKVQKWLMQVENLAREADRLADALHSAHDAAAGGKAAPDLPNLTRKVTQELEALEQEFIGECSDLKSYVVQQKSWHYTESVLAVPLIADVRQRTNLIYNSRKISNELHRSSEAKGTRADTSGSKLEDLARQRAQHEGFMALAVAGEPWSGKQTRDKLHERIENAGENWRTTLSNVGVFLAEHGQHRLQTIKKGWDASLEAKDLDKAAAAIQPAEHFCRLVSTGDTYRQINQLPFDPVQAARRLRLHNLLCWQAERTARDLWAADPDYPTEPYYVTVAHRFLKDAQQLADGKEGNLVVNQARKKKAADLQASITAKKIEAAFQGETTQHLTGAKSEMAWNFQADGLPPGKPVVWLEIAGDLVKDAQGPDYLDRVPLENWPPKSKNFLLFSKLYNEKNPRPIPEEKSGTARLYHIYRGQKSFSEVALAGYEAPDIIASRFPPPPEGTLSVKMAPNLSYGALCIVLDFSGSMGWGLQGQKDKSTPRIEYVRKALKPVIESIPSGTYLSVYGFASKRMKDPNNQIGVLHKPQIWLGTQAEINALIGKINAEEPGYQSPIAEAMMKARREGFPKNYQGAKVMLVLSDGADSEFIKNKALQDEHNVKTVSNFIEKEFDRKGVEVNFVCFATAKEAREAEDQFKVIEEIIPRGKFTSVTEAHKLATTLEEALRPRLKFDQQGKFYKELEDGLLVPRSGQNPDPKTIPVNNPEGIDLTARLQNIIQQDLRLRPGELLPLIIKSGKIKALQLERAIFGKELKTAQISPNGKWLGAVPENNLNAGTSTLTQLLTLEDLPSALPSPGSILQHRYPGFIWLEVTNDKGKKPQSLRWHHEYGKPAPAYRLQAARFGLGEEPQLSAWFLESQTPSTLFSQSFPFGDFVDGKKFQMLDFSLTIEEVVTDDRYVTVAANKDKVEKRCLVVQVRYPKDHPIWLKPVGIQYQGEEHHYFSKAGRYVALFWGAKDEPVRFDVISLKHLKEARQAVQSLEWKLPSPSLKLAGY